MRVLNCHGVQGQLDAFVSGETPAESGDAVRRHLEGCPQCLADHADRVRVRDALRQAIRAELPPPDLAARIRTRIHHSPPPRPWFALWTWAAATASVAGVGFAAVVATDARTPVFAVNIAAQEVRYLLASRSVDPEFRPGLADHLHCTVSRRHPDHFPLPEELGAQERLEPEWSGLANIVRSLAPRGYSLVQAHRCRRQGRRYVHFAYRNGDGRLASLVISPKAEGALPFVEAVAGRYLVTAFDAGRYSAWTVVDEGEPAARLLASRLRGPVSEFVAGL
jgi:anti-sigma factor (TIGR02949 family)